MFGTIRKHQTWLWAVIITLTLISFLVFFAPSTKDQGRRSDGNRGFINGSVITEEDYFNARQEAVMAYFFNNGGTLPETGKFDEEGQTYQLLLIIRNQEAMGMHYSPDLVAQAGRDMISRFFAKGEQPSFSAFVKQVL